MDLSQMTFDQFSELMGRWAAAVVGGLFLVVGVVMAIRATRLAVASRNWPSVPGRILKSLVTTEQPPTQVGEFRPDVFVAKIEYEYVVAGERHTGTNISVGGDLHTSNRQRAEDAVATYGVGDAVDVFYDPSKPSRAGLVHDAPGIGVMLAVAGVGTVVLIVSVVRAMG
ncbi:MAG: DUF3592 domain-containing protein [Phycisphaerales bacterium]